MSSLASKSDLSNNFLDPSPGILSNPTDSKAPILPSLVSTAYFNKSRTSVLFGSTSFDYPTGKCAEIIEHPSWKGNKNHYYASAYVNADRCQLANVEIEPLQTSMLKEVGGIRGIIKGFSRSARNRLIDMLASIDQESINQEDILFLTLTYAYHITKDDAKQAKRHLNHFNTILRRDLKDGKLKDSKGRVKTNDDIFLVWRIEPMKSERLHFHFAIFGIDFIDADYIRSIWARCTGELNMELENESRIDIQKAKSWGKTAQYFSKTLAYLSKNDNNLLDKFQVGRHWGIVNRKTMQNHIRVATRRISQETSYKSKRILFGCLKRKMIASGKWTNKYARNMKNWLLNEYRTVDLDGILSNGRKKKKLKMFIRDKTFWKLINFLEFEVIMNEVKQSNIISLNQRKDLKKQYLLFHKVA